MALELFESEGEDEYILKGSFEEIVEKGWTLDDFYNFVGGNLVWTASECSVVRSEPPSEHDYQVDVIFLCRTSKKEKTLQVSAVNVDATSSTINGLLHLGFASADKDVDITLKCFATNPRQPIAAIQPLSISTDGRHHSCLRLQFLSLDEPTTQAMVNSNISHLELRQTTTEGLSHSLGHQSLLQGPKKMTVSCTMAEFAKLAAGLGDSCTVEHLELLLHFWVQGEALKTFNDSLKSNKGLQSLTIQYLDIADDGWESFCQAVQNHPSIREINAGFTEKFVDKFRRLTPERRTERTKAVLQLVQGNPRIQEFTWPDFQQDESIQNQIHEILRENSNEQ